LDWASGGKVTDPGGAKEAAGWEVSEKPPAYWWNWILNSFGQWLTYFEEATDEARLRAYGRVAIDLSDGSLTLSSGSVGVHAGIGSTGATNRLVIYIDVPLEEGWLATAVVNSPTEATQTLSVYGWDGSEGTAGAGTVDLVVDVFTSSTGGATDIDGGGSGTIYVEFGAFGTLA
jgi:hypothetical protein